MDPLFWGKVGEAALRLLKRFWYVVPIVVLAAMLHFSHASLKSKDKELAAAKVEHIQLEDRNRVTQASLEGALARIVLANKAADAAAIRYTADLAAAAAAEAAANTRYKSTAATVTQLEASAKAGKPIDPNKPSAAALKALEQL